MQRAVIYARFSSHNQREESIEQQVAECRAYAAANHYTVVDVYADSAVSGRSDRRPQFLRLRRDAGKHIFDTIIAYKSSRIARNMLNALNFEMEMTKQGVSVVYAKEEFGNSAAGRFALRTMMSVNQFYSENLGEDIKRTQADNAQSCRANGPAPYGYKSGPDGRFVIDEERANIVREIYARYADMESIASIARDLNTRGIKNSLGNDWGRSSFKNIIGNERYKGIYIFDGTRIDGGMPRIIDDDTFDEAVRAMRAKGRRKNPASDYQLTGKLFCGECKETMIGMCGRSKSGSMYYYYACSGHRSGSGCRKTSVGRDQTETAIAKELYAKILNDDILEQIADEVMAYQKKFKDNPEIKALRDQKDSIEKAIKNIMAAIEAGIFTDTTKARLLELEDEQKRVNGLIAEASLDQINVTKDQVIGYLKSFRGGDINDKKYRTRLFDTFLVSAYVYDDHITIVFDPLGGDKNNTTITFDNADFSPGGVRLCACVGHQMGVRRTLYILFTVPISKQ